MGNLKRERLEKTIAGEATDRVPAALWRHWPGDDQRAPDFARAVLDFQKQWDFDVVKVTPANTYSLLDYGLQDAWKGNLEGEREITRLVVERSIDWTELRKLDPTRGSLGMQLDALQMIKNGLDENVPLIQTIYSPLTQAEGLAGRENLLRDIRLSPDRIKTGLNYITENILRQLETLQKVGIAGIFYVIRQASYHLLSKTEYRELAEPYDLRILNLLPSRWWFNGIYIEGQAPMLDVIADYPAQVLSWNDRGADTDLRQGQLKFKGAVCGGLERWNVHDGTPGAVREQARDALAQTYSRRLILSTGANLVVSTPLSNIRMVRQVVEG
ncbi:MAG: hypothetical protein K8I82_21175 [Anaerolineae bacterium]|nr:hypothetical protein [Anaerolineae bacterium]